MKIIDVFICKLRKKLALAGAGDVIGTVWGRGYMVRDQAAHGVPNVVLGHLLSAASDNGLAMLPCTSPQLSAMAQLSAA